MRPPRWPTQRSARVKPAAWSWWRINSRIGRSPTGTSGLGRTVVYGLRRVPLPPARITARMSLPQSSPGGVSPGITTEWLV